MPKPVDHLLFSHVVTRLTTEFPQQLERCLAELDDDDVWWRPDEQANAVANLVLHLAGSNRFYLQHVIGGSPNMRDRDAEFAARGGETTAEVLRVWRDATADVAAILGGLTAAHLTQPTTDRGRSVAEVLLHVTHHNALHIGQIVWITKLRRPGVIQELLRRSPPPPDIPARR